MATRTDFLDRLTAMVVTASSPDGTVRLRLCNADGLSVELTERALDQPEDSLARQVALALTGLRKGYRQGFRAVIDAARRDPRPPREPRPEARLTPRQRSRQRLARRLADIRVQGVSPHGRVRVAMADRDEVEVHIVPRSYHNSPSANHHMAAEIRAAVVAAHDRLQRAKRRVTESHDNAEQ